MNIWITSALKLVSRRNPAKRPAPNSLPLLRLYSESTPPDKTPEAHMYLNFPQKRAALDGLVLTEKIPGTPRKTDQQNNVILCRDTSISWKAVFRIPQELSREPEPSVPAENYADIMCQAAQSISITAPPFQKEE